RASAGYAGGKCRSSRFSAPCEDRITALFSPGNSASAGVASAGFLASGAGCVCTTFDGAAFVCAVGANAPGLAGGGIPVEGEAAALAAPVVGADVGSASAESTCVSETAGVGTSAGCVGAGAAASGAGTDRGGGTG